MKGINSLIFAFFGFAIVSFAQSSADEIRKWKKDAMFKPKISKKMIVNLLKGWEQAIRKTLA